jgi:hypothetical protein
MYIGKILANATNLLYTSRHECIDDFEKIVANAQRGHGPRAPLALSAQKLFDFVGFKVAEYDTRLSVEEETLGTFRSPENESTVRVFDRNLHSRMPLVPTPARLSLLA